MKNADFLTMRLISAASALTGEAEGFEVKQFVIEELQALADRENHVGSLKTAIR